MPRYYFHVHDGSTLLDHEGSELPDLQAARREALQVAKGLLDSADRRKDLGEEWRIEVTNQTGSLIFRMDFLVAEIEAIPLLLPEYLPSDPVMS